MSVPVASSFVSLLGLAYGTVLLAELLGDKSIYTITALTLRFRAAPMLLGIALAFMGKMSAAVLAGKLLLRVPDHLTALLSAASFFACVFLIWRGEDETTDRAHYGVGWLRAFAVSFASIFLSEWCDVGQLAAAALSARRDAALPVWIGGTAALLTKAVLAMFIGVKLLSKVPRHLARLLASTAYCVLGLLSIARTISPALD